MSIKSLKPYTPSSRGSVSICRSDIWPGRPKKSLVTGKSSTGGRSAAGQITTRHHGGGHKRMYRFVDFKRASVSEGVIERLEYDPNRTAYIALLRHVGVGDFSYVIAVDGMKRGDLVRSGVGVAPSVGNALPLKEIPIGSVVSCIELKPGKGAQLARAAGTSARVMGRNGDCVLLRLSSGCVKLVPSKCYATVGSVSNPDNKNIKLGKAGRRRWCGVRPTVRGVAMNPVDHPHGGGEGRTSGGRHPVTPWGFGTKGRKTVRKKKTNKLMMGVDNG